MKNYIFTLLAVFLSSYSFAQFKDRDGNSIEKCPRFTQCKDVAEDEAISCFKTQFLKGKTKCKGLTPHFL